MSRNANLRRAEASLRLEERVAQSTVGKEAGDRLCWRVSGGRVAYSKGFKCTEPDKGTIDMRPG